MTTTQSPPLGFVGLGHMGAPMALRLLDAGYPLHIFDTNPGAMRALVAHGATAAASASALAATVDTICLCLPTPAAVRDVALGPDGVAGGARVRIVIDLSTTGPVVEKQVASGLRERGITLVDAPVSGGIAGAQAGTLAVMVACPRETFEEVTPILRHLGRTFYTGTSAGLGQTAKLANNLLSAVALAASSEAMAMGVKAGLDPQVLLDIINAGSGRNSATLDKFPRAVLSGTYDFGMATGLFLKDVRLCVDEAESLGVPMVIGAAVRQMFGVTQARFGPQSDFTCVAKVLEEWADVNFSTERQ